MLNGHKSAILGEDRDSPQKAEMNENYVAVQLAIKPLLVCSTFLGRGGGGLGVGRCSGAEIIGWKLPSMCGLFSFRAQSI